MTWRAIALVAGVTVLGLVGGAAWAAPTEVLPLAHASWTKLGLAGRGALSDAVAVIADAAGAWTEPGPVQVLVVGNGSPRRLAMTGAAVLMLAAGVAALRVRRRAGDATRRVGVASATWSTGSEQPVAESAPGWRRSSHLPAVRLPGAASSPMPPAPRRRKAKRASPSHEVHLMAASGSSPLEIARRSGLALDAVAMMLAMVDTASTSTTRSS